ncbi:MAG: hypothetical protein ACK4K7_12700 [Allosphingosinicella sp.]|uniref:hypothetical protein n=1 Tax=Allosphingosinicella sp. TaxID=2823234 RepID=UPI0039483000
MRKAALDGRPSFDVGRLPLVAGGLAVLLLLLAVAAALAALLLPAAVLLLLLAGVALLLIAVVALAVHATSPFVGNAWNRHVKGT